MKRKFLEGFNLEKESINKIMAEYGKDITKLKKINEKLHEELVIKEKMYKRNAIKVKKQFKEFNKKNIIEKQLMKYKPKNIEILNKLIDLDKIKVNNYYQTIEGLDEQIHFLKKNYNYLFISKKNKRFK